MIKQFSAGDIITRPFKTFKNWEVQSVNSNGTDQFGRSTWIGVCGEVNRGQNITIPFYPTGSPKYNASVEPVTSNGKYERNVYYLTDSMFYRNPTNPMELFGLESIERDPTTGKKEIRQIHDKIVSLRLAENYWGEKIVPKSVSITDDSNFHNTYKIYDDGMTNLYITGSHFSTQYKLSAINPLPPLPVWNTSSGQFYAVLGGATLPVSFSQAKQYMDLGVDVSYVPSDDMNGWEMNYSASRDYYQPENERFGQSVSAWFKYVGVGSPMDGDSLSSQKQGYAAMFKYDESVSQHKLIKKFISPQSQAALASEFGLDNNQIIQLENNNYLGLETSGSFEDSFGYSVSVKDNFFAVGAPTGSSCYASGSKEGFVYVYDRFKGGSDNWGLINVLQGGTEGDRFGNCVSIDGDVLAVGAPGVSGSIGAVYIFRLKRYMDSTLPCRNIPTASFWYQINECGLPKRDIFGNILYTSVNTPTFASGNFSWEYEATLTSNISATGDNFGWTLEVSNDRVIVGNRKVSGNGYATLFVCNYVSSSFGACPTASWVESMNYFADETLGDLDPKDPQYAVQNTPAWDGFGWSVAIDAKNMAIGSFYDMAFLPYDGAPLIYQKILGAVYFYHDRENDCIPPTASYYQVQKTFGNRENWFGRKISIEGLKAAVSEEPTKTYYSVDFGGSFILESSSYQASGSTDGVLGRVFMYSSNADNTWTNVGEIRRNKEAGQPFGVFGRGLSLSSDFLIVGTPIYNYATGSNTSSIYDHNIQISSSMSSMYSGSIYVYDLDDYENNPHVGNVFYKNGYAVITDTGSNYENILTGTGIRGFDMNYQGTHTIYEHEYTVSINPGEFNYSTNPSSLVQNSTLFDVNQDGIFDLSDLDLIMRYLHKKRFYEDYVFDDNGIVLEQSNKLGNWWADDILLTEANDVLLQESDFAAYLVSSSFTAFTKKAFDYIEANLVQTGILDIDGNGVVDLHDGAILTAYFTNKLTPTTLDSWIDGNSTRRYVTDIENYIGKYTGQQRFYTNPDFFGYQASCSYDPTGSYLSPVITTIGLYDKSGELVAVSKLGKPIKNLIDWPINFIVRFDT